MFFATRPLPRDLDRLLAESSALPLTYDPIGLAERSPPGYSVDEIAGSLGRGDAVFERAKTALARWRHFDLGWAEIFPRNAPVDPGVVVLVVVRHLGFWSANGCRVVYAVGHRRDGPRFGFAYGTLSNHAEAGEEIFEVGAVPESGEVRYRVRAVSRPRAAIARAGYPLVRHLQARFRRDSLAAMLRAVGSPG